MYSRTWTHKLVPCSIAINSETLEQPKNPTTEKWLNDVSPCDMSLHSI